MALAKGIVRNANSHEVFILLNDLFRETIDHIYSEFSGLLGEDRFLVFKSCGPVSGLNADNRWRRRSAEVLREFAIESLAPDVLLITSMVEGGTDDAITSLGMYQTRVPTAAVLYDLIPMTDPDKYIGWEPARLWYYDKIDSLRRADHLFAISQATMGQAIKLLQLDPDRVTNISSAADETFSTGRVKAANLNAVLKKHGIKEKYLMHSSAFEARKNFEGLIQAFSSLPKITRKEHQLVLVCKLSPPQREQLVRLSAKLGLDSTDVIFTGFVPDDELVALYASCHLFVFPSFQEGFGLPALEAMSCGVPTIGSNTTSVPEVIGRFDALFDPYSVGAMSALILRALTDGDFYASLKAHALTQSAKFSWDATSKRAICGLERLVLAKKWRNRNGISSEERRWHLANALAHVARDDAPSDREVLELAELVESNDNAVSRVRATAAFLGKLSWRLEGPFDSSYSLALVNRETARAIEALGHRVVLHSTEGPGDFDPNIGFLERNPDLAAMHLRVASHSHSEVDAVSRNLYPPRVEDMSAKLKLLHQYAWEETGIPIDWVSSFNSHLDHIACTSEHVRKVLIDNGVFVSLTTSGNGVDHWERITPTNEYPLQARRFRFLHVSSCFPRKGIDVLLEAYGSVFTRFDDVSLVIKTFPNPHNDVQARIDQWKARSVDFPHVVVINQDLSDSQLKALYLACHVMVAPSRAEGFGLPLAEAMLSGIPVITTAWSGQLEFCNESTSWLLDYDFQQSQSHLDVRDSVWADPNVDSLGDALRSAFGSSHEERAAKSLAGRKLLLEKFCWRDVAARMIVGAVAIDHFREPLAPMKIGWITTWNTKCGIASYSSYFITEFPQTVTILAPHQEGRIGIDGPNCLRSWKADKEENGFDELSDAIGRLGLNVLILQFNYGFYNFRQLSQFIVQQIEAQRVLLVMMHATSDPGLKPDWNWTLSELIPALSRCDRVLVHSISDLNTLKTLGLTNNVAFFPHGVLRVSAEQLQNTLTKIRGAGSIPIVATYGFCLPHKGLPEIVRAAGLLRDAGFPLRLRLVNAEYPVSVSAALISQLRELVRDLALQDLVEFHHEFLPDLESTRLLSDADLVVFPYQQTNESASGAVRIGMASGRPIAVTPIPVFGDLGEAAFILPGIEPHELARGIREALHEIEKQSAVAAQVAANADVWRSGRHYDVLSSRLHRICRALAPSKTLYGYVFDGSNQRIQTEVGRIAGRSLITTGAAGYLIYRTYMVMPAGLYRVSLIGYCRLTDFLNVRGDVCINGGEIIVAKFTASHETSNLIASIHISLAKPVSDLEVRLWVSEVADARLDELKLEAISETAA